MLSGDLSKIAGDLRESAVWHCKHLSIRGKNFIAGEGRFNHALEGPVDATIGDSMG